MAAYKPSWDLETVPDNVFYAEAARRMTERRKVSGGSREGAGRKPEMVPCPRCGRQVTKTEARRGHGCR